jgi:hypothetical protein
MSPPPHPSLHRARGRRTAEKLDELTALQLIELHPNPPAPGLNGRIPNWWGSVSTRDAVSLGCVT